MLLPGAVANRWVAQGDLGCPVCGRAFHVNEGVLDFGDGPAGEPVATGLDAEAAVALSGLTGPGGYLVLVGGAARNHVEISAALPGVGLVAVNASRTVRDGAGVSVLRGDLLPLKSSSMRGVLLGPGYGDDPFWIGEALRVTLPGLRIVGEGKPPERSDLEVLASAGGCWVGAKVRNRL